MIHVKVSIGDRIHATATGDDSKRVLEEVAFFSELPATCPLCDAAVNFYFRNPKEFTYYGLKCIGSPAHECTFGQKRDGSGLFYKGKDSWDKAYVGDGGSGGSGGGGGEAAPEQTAVPAGAPAEDDIPF